MLLVAIYPTIEGERVSLYGPVGDPPLVHHNLEVSQVERLAEVALSEAMSTSSPGSYSPPLSAHVVLESLDDVRELEL